MTFARIEILFLVWLIPVLALAYYYGRRKRRKILNAFASRQGLAQIAPTGLTRRRLWRAGLVLTAGMLLVAAMAGPRYGYQWQEIQRQGVDIVIALDCSRSMLAADIQPTRLDRAKREIYDLLTMLQGDRVGLVAFSGTAFLQCPLTIDYTALYLFLDVLNPDYLPLGGSDLAAAVTTAQHAFDPQSKTDKAIILITDGENTGQQDPIGAARMAQDSGIKLFCIGVGSKDKVPIPASEGGFKKDAGGQIVLSRLDESLLTRMAATAGGAYVRSVAGDMDLDAIYHDQIRARMEAGTVESSRKRLWADRYQWPLAIAVILLIGTRWVPLMQSSSAVLLVFLLFSAVPPAWAGPQQKGYQAYEAQQFDEAMEQFSKAQLNDPNNPTVLYNLGNTLYKKQDFAGAIAHYNQALPHASEYLESRLLYNLGNASYRQGQLQQAIEHYEAALNIQPDDKQASENLAFVKKRLQQQQQDKPKQSQNDDQPQDRSGQNRKQDGMPKDRQESAPAPQSDSEKDANEQPDPADQQPQSAEAQSAQPQSQEQPQPGRQPEAQLLNRLKDQPGRAMMPNYQKRTVDKDW
jgi:Ca-activated chloride channel family protein